MNDQKTKKMIVSFDVKDIDDLNLLLSLAKRLGIERVEQNRLNHQDNPKSKEISSHEMKDFNEINLEIDSIFGVDNSNISF